MENKPDTKVPENDHPSYPVGMQPKDHELDAAIDEIVREEADATLVIGDARAPAEAPQKNRAKKWSPKRLFLLWWHAKKVRNITFLALAILLAVSAVVPDSRYAILNVFGVRVSSSMVVVDEKSGRPLKNIPVRLQNKEVRTDSDGAVNFTDLKLGRSKLVIDKKGFAPFERTITLGFGSNPLGERSLLATGARYKFAAKDWLSGRVVQGVEAVSGEDVGLANEQGEIELIVSESDENTEVVLSAEGYRDETLSLSDVNQEKVDVLMVPKKKHAYISNRNGTYDLYSKYADGRDEIEVLGGTKKEREIPYIEPHPSENIVAFVSARDGETNKDGFVLDGLFTVDIITRETYKITRSEQIQVVGWDKNRLLYVAVVEGTSAGNSQRSKLFSFDLESKQRQELASSNYFNDVKLYNGVVYYAVSSFAVPRSQAKLFSVNSDGTNKKTLRDEQVWSLHQGEAGEILANSETGSWYELKDGGAVLLDNPPTEQQLRKYVSAQSTSSRARIELRDGKGVLLVTLEDSPQAEKDIVTSSGVDYPLYWLSDEHLVYRVSTSQESADYVVSVYGGEPKKIADVLGNRSRYFF